MVSSGRGSHVTGLISFVSKTGLRNNTHIGATKGGESSLAYASIKERNKFPEMGHLPTRAVFQQTKDMFYHFLLGISKYEGFQSVRIPHLSIFQVPP